MNTLFAKHILSVPTFSGKEDFFIDCIKKWCRIVGIKATQDGKGNLYLVKGQDKWMPCLCSHLDTVHKKYIPYIEKKELLPVQLDGDRFFIDGMGVGADCKAGVAICLSVMRKVKNCKCVLFVEEETGMVGSKSLDATFFDNVSYVLSWDSPGGNRATKTSSGVPMFTDEFFEVIKPIYKSHGVTNWKHEPWTDTVQIVKKVGVCCVNAKNGGGMDAHTDKEDCSLKEMNDSEQLCLDAIAQIPCDRKWEIKYEEPPKPKYSSYFSSSSKYSHAPHQEEEVLPASVSMDDNFTDIDLEQRDDTEFCTFSFTYDDDEQYETHKKIIKQEGVFIDLDELDPLIMTADAAGELQEIKNAYILWYQLFYNSPEVKSWEQLKQAEAGDLSDFEDGLVFIDDETSELDDIDLYSWQDGN